jgi:hypothetical protein
MRYVIEITHIIGSIRKEHILIMLGLGLGLGLGESAVSPL